MVDVSIGFDLGGQVVVSGPEAYAPKDPKKPRPGDLTQFLSYGEVSAFHRPRSLDLIRSAPETEASGGVLYFDGKLLMREHLRGLLSLLELRPSSKDYALFVSHSTGPKEQGHLTQLRFVPRHALQYAFGVLDEGEYDAFPEQGSTLEEVLWSFTRHEHERWVKPGASKLDEIFGSADLQGTERLAFGFLLENAHYRVCRIWSRAWLDV